ncbi:MAG TPA: 3-methyl-2-oxobutanoate hydroxymethyltransferase [Rhizomicrobium sp.]|nr:3-methyl-2-oxobutanoate hydroxymethyltransferase [Rhizomicrobium sp.]
MSTTPQTGTSGSGPSKRLTTRDILARKAPGRASDEPVVCITAYTAPMARLMDEHVDLLLVGDSVAMVVYGMETTLGVSLEIMIAHGKAVMRGSSRACVVVDMPFGSYQESPQQAFRSCARVLAETGCAGVKLEGGVEMAETVQFLVARGIPVMGHVGVTPQSVNQLGGYRARGRTNAEADRIIADGQAIAEAGAFALVVEGTVEPVARALTGAVEIPTIGIGASVACDGQIIVGEDILGLFGTFIPKFVKRYAELGDAVSDAVSRYAADVRARRFPGHEQMYGAPRAQPVAHSSSGRRTP